MTRCYTDVATGSAVHYSECIVIRLFERIGDGATGDVYRAKLELYRSSGGSDTCDEPIVVKLSRTSEGQAALEHEYSIYEHLSTLRTPLKGIPPCLGLFDGDESEQSALILGDCGQTLALRTGRYEPAVTVSNIECSGYLRILDGLHAADVLHGDLRTWNMLIDDDGQPALIDFDRARRNPSQDDIVKERARLVKLLDGFEVDDDS
ncbi:hypothetical protein BDZ89DRAFT_1125735 [Hymenopellis radicata]|nr:hypothetical protein BDZ89DRAFT_1125735 [Hymenopellis radicata]